MTVFDKYFKLWDAALFDEAKLEELINLFANDAIIKTPQGSATGTEMLKSGIKQTLENYISMNHVWNTQETDDGFVATWAVTHELKNGQMHAAVGVDYMQLDNSGKIKFLEIKPAENITQEIKTS